MMDSMLDEYMQDVLAESDTYREETFEAFESDADSMLLLGLPIDDQIRTMNISSFAIPKKNKAKLQSPDALGEEVDYEDFESEEGEEIDEEEYEDSFESPGKSPNKQDLKELSSITFAQSKMEDSQVQDQLPSLSPQKEKKKRGKKKKRVAPTAAATLSTSVGGKSESNGRGAPTTIHAANSTTYPTVGQPGQKKESPRGLLNNDNATATVRSSTRPSVPRSNIGGAAVGGIGTSTGQKLNPGAGASASAASSIQQYHIPQPYHHENSVIVTHHGRPVRTPPVHSNSNPGPGSVVSQAPSQSVAGRQHAAHTGGAFSAAILQKQLDTALKQVAMYRKENEMLQHSLDGAGINEAVERYKALLISKEHTIHQLESENNGLKSIARYQGKFLNDQAHQPTGIDSIQNHDKQIEIMLVHTRKMKEKVKKLEAREKELVEENEYLRIQNGRIQRKNVKLKKLLKMEGAAAVSSPPEHAGTLQPLQQQQQDVITALTSATRDLTVSPDGESEKSNVQMQICQSGSGSIVSANVIDQLGSHTSHESLGADHILPQEATQKSTLRPAPTNNVNKSALKKALDEKDAQLHKQAATIESLERSLQTQRSRFQREIEVHKSQADEAIAEQKTLQAELDKRERFGRNQASTLKQIRSSYEELSAGYKKLLQASELYDRDTAPPVRQHRDPPAPARVPTPPEQAAAPRGAQISEEDDFNYISPQRPQSSRSSSSRGGSRSAANMTFLTTEKFTQD